MVYFIANRQTPALTHATLPGAGTTQSAGPKTLHKRKMTTMIENEIEATVLAAQPARPGAEYEPLNVFIGKWINQGNTIENEQASSVNIVTSDVYEWAPGGFFILHYAYGLVGEQSGGGVEIIGYDPANDRYTSHFFDSQGNIAFSELTERYGVWTWLGDWAGEKHRATSVFSEDGKVQACLHERSSDGVTWQPSMEVLLTRVD